jgi:WD40 repeat protein
MEQYFRILQSKTQATMRIPFLGFILFCTVQLAAQKGKDPYYIQQAVVPEQKALDCYQRSLEEGLSAQKRGDCRLALRWFRDAQSCPEVLKIPEREAEIKTLIAQCSEKPVVAPTATKRVTKTRSPLPNSSRTNNDLDTRLRRRFQPSRQFLQYDKPECFDITCREAARAYAGGYWDDAAALFRAAKNCTDADQVDRLEANRRIAACKAASQNELRKKEQEAIKQARHAIAANRANDANQLLRNLDRSLAYRLADFANEYIAPEDNDACQQAMFNAVYHTPSVHSELPDDNMQIPFSYQLGDNLDSNLYVRFLGKGEKEKIYAFAPSRHLLFQWNANTLKPETPIQLEDTTMTFMDAVPDGRTLLFRSSNAFLFWRTPSEVFRLPVRNISNHCFSADGRTFFFLDVSEMAVYALDLVEAFATRKGSSRAAPEPTGIKADWGILQIAGGNGQFWLGYRDSIVAYSPQRNVGRLWGRERSFPLGYRIKNFMKGEPPKLSLDPLARTAVFTTDMTTIFFEIPETDTASIQPSAHLSGQLLASSTNAKLIATYVPDWFGKNSYMYLYSPEKKTNKFGALIPSDISDLQLRTGSFSLDSRLLATTNSAGKLEVWKLADDSTESETDLGPNKFAMPSADGSSFFFWRNDSLMRVPADQLDWVLESAKAPAYRAFPYLTVQQNWLAYRTGADAVVLTNKLGEERLTVPSPAGGVSSIVGDFSLDEHYFTCLVGSDSVVGIYDLNNAQLEATRTFGGLVERLYFVPETGEVLVVHQLESDNSGIAKTVIKLWNPALPPREALRSVRLQDYETREVVLSETRGYIAFTNGLDIRVFRQNDLLDETIRIRQNGYHMVTTMCFHPDGTMLAAGYEDGSVVFWDIASGQARFTWAARPVLDSSDIVSIHRLRFVENGRQVQLYIAGNRLLTKDLEVSLIRASMQSDFRKLISFRPNQIRQYGLEQALDYPNNFARLAASGDLPLIRSFFDYFRETALNSNNIQRVENSCNRAASLFGQLDPSTQEVLRPILLDMFEDYHWKLLLRNQITPAQKVADAMNRDFGNPVVAIRAAAHTALLRGDIRGAARLYVEWALRSAETGNENGLLDLQSIADLYNKVSQLSEYNLLQPVQFDCLCSLFGAWTPFDLRCKKTTAGSSVALLDAQTNLRWRIFQQLTASQTVKNHKKRVQLLETALADTRQLQRQYPDVYQRTIEIVHLALGKAYFEWGEFEQRSGLALEYLQRACEQLSANGSFQTVLYERARLSELAKYYLHLGIVYQNLDKLAPAISAFRKGIQETTRLLELVKSDQVLTQKYRDDLSSKLQTQTGLVFLLQGNADAAQEAFTRAQEDKAEGIHRLYFGHEDLLDESETAAELEYLNIKSELELGQALFQIEQMTWYLPAQRRRMLPFLHALRKKQLKLRPQLDSTAVDYYWAYNKIIPFAGQAKWDSAYYWSAVASKLALQIFEQPEHKTEWQNHWLNAQLNQAYFLLFSNNRGPSRFSEVIQLSQEAEDFFNASSDFVYYKYKSLIKTNLAHAYWLRNQAGDRDRARAIYNAYLSDPLEKFDPWEVLFKDFRDLHAAGVPFPGLGALIQQIRPAKVQMEPADWEALGIEAPEE